MCIRIFCWTNDSGFHFWTFYLHGNRIALAVYSLGPADRLRLGQESKCNCFSFWFLQIGLLLYIYSCKLHTVSIIQRRSWMIYLDRVDKGMESLIQKHNLVWIKLFTSEETFSNNISVDFSGKFKIKFGKSKEWKFSAQK